MKVHTKKLTLTTTGNGDMLDVTGEVQEALTKSGLGRGVVNVFVVGSTAAITTIEFEPGLEKDLNTALEAVAPKKGHYEHTERWHDDNGHSHVRASLVGPSLTVPFESGRLELGTWQQIVLVDFDTHSRDRQAILKFIGE